MDGVQPLPPTGAQPPNLRRDLSSTESPSLASLKSVDSVPVTGIYPLGSLRVNELKDDEESDTDLLPTPLTVPDRTPERTMDKDAELLKGGDVLILDDLPSNFTVGCDTISFSTTQQFLGFRDIPLGTHLVWVAPSESTSSRSGYWIITPGKDANSPGKVYVKQWNKYDEVLSATASHAEERIQRENLSDVFSNLAPYQFKGPTSAVVAQGRSENTEPLPPFLNNTLIWHQLTSAIHAPLLDRLVGSEEGTWPVNTTDRTVGGTGLAGEAKLYATSSAQLNFRFPMDQRLFDPTAEGPERTKQALDPTSFVLANSHDNENTLLGELQFAFLTGMHLGNYSCLEQWWHLASSVVFRSYRLAVERPRLVRDLIKTLHAQLVYSDTHLEGEPLTETMPTQARRLQRAMTVYKSRLNEQLLSLGDRCSPEQQEVGAAFASLESWLWRLSWDLRGEYVRAGTVMLEDGEVVEAELSDFESEDERGEFAAVVVDLDEDGRQKDLVSV